MNSKAQDLGHSIHEALEKTLQSQEYELIGLIPIPQESDRRVRFQTLHQLVEDFDSGLGEQWVGYVVQAKKRINRASDPLVQNHPSPSNSTGEPVFMPDGRMNAPYLLKNAEILLSHGDLALAKRIYHSLLKSGEMLGQAYYGLGKCLDLEGLAAEARDAYEKSITYLPTVAAARDLSRLYVRRGQESEAVKTLERCLQGRDVSIEDRKALHFEVGKISSSMNLLPEARKHFAAVIELGGTGVELLCELGHVELRLGHLSDARRCFQDALAIRPHAPAALRGLGSCLVQEGDLRGAHDAYAQCLEGDLGDAKALHELVRIAYELKSYSTAARLLSAYIQAHPITPSLLYTLAGLDFHLGRLSEARSVCKKVLDLDSEHLGAAELLRMIDRYSGSP